MTIVRTHNGSNESDSENMNTGSDKIYQNYLMPGLELFDARVTINHWQLRDCIKPYSKDNNKLYYIYDHSIRSLNTDSNFFSYDPPNLSNRNKKSKISKYSYNKNTSKYLSNSRNDLYGSPTEKVVEFNFKPRCFTELNGLTACGGLVGSDDKGFPTNWNRISHESSAIDTTNSLVLPTQPIKLATRNILSDNSNYSNPNIWKGILSIYNEATDFKTSVVLGQFINNCVTLHNRSTQAYNLYTCNNDGHIYQCDVSNRSIELVKRYSDLKFPLNNASLSHDGKTLIASGDSNKFAIYRQNEIINQFSLNYDNQSNWGSSKYNKVKILPKFDLNDSSHTLDNNIFETTNGDHGFYNCFSENDLQFATLFQNGICLMYDIRNTSSPLAEISSTRPQSHNGAFRACRFSYGLDDLLFISEHQGRVHVVDTRNFSNHQIIFLPNKLTLESNDIPNGNSSDSLNAINNSIRSSRQNRNIRRGIVSRSNLPYDTAGYPSTRSIGNIEPWVTSANKLPLKFLEPRILPYPKAFNKLSNHFINHRNHYNRSVDSSLSVDSPSSNSTSTSNLTNQIYTSRSVSYDDNQKKRRSSFTIRRISTSSNSEESIKNYKSNIDPEITMDSSTFDRGSGYHSNILRQNIEDTLFDDEGEGNAYYSHPEDSSDNSSVLDNYEPRINRNLIDPIIEYSNDNCLTEENNISGINWVNDNDGSSLVIGTDYGIIKWKINSWARRSFASYDFC